MNEVLDDVEVAQILGCDTKTVQEKASAGELPAVKFGRSWRFPRAALLQVLNDLALGNKRRHQPQAVLHPTETKRRKPPALVNPI
jgi:excisionase family DNA binding protein